MLMSMDDIRELNRRKEQERLAAEAQAQAPAQAQPGLLQMPEKPMTPFEQLRDNHGTGGAIMRLLGTGLSGGLLGGFLTPEIGKASQAEYATDLATYKAYQTKLMEQQLAEQAAQAERKGVQSGLDLLMNGVHDPEDAYYRMKFAKDFGMDPLQYALGGGIVNKGAFGDGTQVERMLSMYYDENAPLEHRRIARDFLNKPYNVTTPDGTYTYEGLGLRGFNDDGSFMDPEPSQATDPSGRPAQFTEASSAGEREKETLVDLIGEAAGIYDMEPKFFDTAVAETLPPYISAGLMSETGQQYEAYKASIKSVVGKIYSGAVLNETEIENVQRGYIPQPGDTEATIKLKKRRLEALMSAYNKDPENFDAQSYYRGGGYSASPRHNALEKHRGG